MERFIQFCHEMKNNNIVLYVSLDGITELENKNRGLSSMDIESVIDTITRLK